MSADNAYFVLSKDGTWSVAHGSMSPYIEDEDSRWGPLAVAEYGKTYRASLFEKGRKFDSYEAAVVYAHEQVDREPIVEYGVVVDEVVDEPWKVPDELV